MIETLLILGGVGLLITEAFIPLFGLIGLMGLALVITGTILAFNDTLLDHGFGTIFGISFILAALIGGAAYYIFKTYRQKTQTGREGLIGSTARVIDWSGKQGRVKVDGESWHAISNSTFSLSEDDIVTVIAVEGLSLNITKHPEHQPQTQDDQEI